MSKRGIFLYGLLWVIVALTQVAFWTNWRIYGFVPNLVTIFLVILLFRDLRDSRIVAGLVTAGFLLDLFHSSLVGLTVLILIAVYLITLFLRTRYLQSVNPWLIAVISAGASIVFDISAGLLTRVPMGEIVFHALGNGFYTSIATAIVIGVLTIAGLEFEQEGRASH